VSAAFRNGRFVDDSDLTLGYADAGVVEGATVTDFARTYGGTLFRWPDHCDRFERDCAELGILVPESRAEQTAAAVRLLQGNHPEVDDAAVIRFATPGPLRRMNPNLAEAEYRPTFGMHTIPLPASRYAHLAAGARLHLAGRMDAGIVPVHVKHRSRLAWRLAEQAVPPGRVAMLIDERGHPDTALGAVLAIRGTIVLRPPVGTVLESVSFLVVRDLCAELGFDFRDGNFDVRDRPSYEALLLAGTGFGLAPVAAVDGTAMSRHPTATALIDAFAMSVRSETSRI